MSYPLTGDGVWCEVRRRRALARPVLVLDRDGTLVEETNYLHEPEKVSVIPGSGRLLARARELDWSVAVVTNQAGIGRGLFGWADFKATQEAVYAALRNDGAPSDGGVDLVLAAPHHPDGLAAYAQPDPWYRKPNPGMYELVNELLEPDLTRSLAVGDRANDLAAAIKGGVAHGVLVSTGYGSSEREQADARKLATGNFQVRFRENLFEVGKLLEAIDSREI